MLTLIHRKTRYIWFVSLIIPMQWLLLNTMSLATAGVVETIKASVSSEGIQGNDLSISSRLSGNGERIVFTSFASNLVVNDTNKMADVFVHDRSSSKTTRVSVGKNGEANGNSESWDISANGRYIVFSSDANNLVESDINQFTDVFLYDFETKLTELISVGSDGAQSYYRSARASVSNDGRYVAFESFAADLDSNDTNNHRDIYLRDRVAKTTRLISSGMNGESANDGSSFPRVSDDGRFVIFLSRASNLVDNDENGQFDLYLYEVLTENLEIVSLDEKGDPFPSVNVSTADISGDGRYIVFSASDMVNSWEYTNVYIRDRESSVTSRISQTADGRTTNSADTAAGVSDNGRYIVYQSFASDIVGNDINEVNDIFVFDRESRNTERVNLDQDNNQLMGFIRSIDPAISNDGRFVSYTTYTLGTENNDVWIAQLDTPDGASLVGKVTLPVGNDHSGILVTISTGDRSVSTVTNAKGEYHFRNLIESSWTVKYSYPQFQSLCRNEKTLFQSQTVVSPVVMADSDLNGDGVVDLLDFFILLFKYGQSSEDAGFIDVIDLNKDGWINVADLVILGSHFELSRCD